MSLGLAKPAGLSLQLVCTGASNSGKKRPSSSKQQAGVASEGQSQQALLQNAMLKAKGRSPPRRHTFNGSDTEFGDAFDTAPSLFMVKSRVIGMPDQLFCRFDALSTKLFCMAVCCLQFLWALLPLSVLCLAVMQHKDVFCTVLPCSICPASPFSSCAVLPCPALLCPALPCPALPCPAPCYVV